MPFINTDSFVHACCALCPVLCFCNFSHFVHKIPGNLENEQKLEGAVSPCYSLTFRSSIPGSVLELKHITFKINSSRNSDVLLSGPFILKGCFLCKKGVVCMQ